jgi:hypothetical protein
MKAIRLILVFITLLLFQYSYGDVIPAHFHYVSKCAKITNISDFDNLTLLGYISDPYGDHSYEISSSECLYKGSAWSVLSIWAVNTQYIEGKNIANINCLNDTNVLMSSPRIEAFDPFSDYIDDSIPVSEIYQFIKVMGFTSSNVILHLWKEIYRYGSADSIFIADSTFTYEYEGDTTELLKYFPLTSIKSYYIDKSVSIFPNPTSDFFNVKVTNNYTGRLRIEVYKANGELLKEYTYYKRNNESYFRLPTSNISKGFYLVQFQFGELIETKRIIIY